MWNESTLSSILQFYCGELTIKTLGYSLRRGNCIISFLVHNSYLSIKSFPYRKKTSKKLLIYIPEDEEKTLAVLQNRE